MSYRIDFQRALQSEVLRIAGEQTAAAIDVQIGRASCRERVS
jgi:hypothetical protein